MTPPEVVPNLTQPPAAGNLPGLSDFNANLGQDAIGAPALYVLFHA